MGLVKKILSKFGIYALILIAVLSLFNQRFEWVQSLLTVILYSGFALFFLLAAHGIFQNEPDWRSKVNDMFRGVLSFIWYFLCSFILRTPSVEKERPDVLVSRAVRDAVNAKLLVPQPGVYCGALSAPPPEADAAPRLRVGVDDRGCVIGPPGTGKTAFLVSQLLDWGMTGNSFICLDIKPEIYGIVRQRMQALGYTLYTYNPTARTGQRYNLLDDVQTPEGIGELASALLPSAGGDAKVFDETARDLLDALVTHLRATNTPAAGPVSLPAVADFIASFDDARGVLKTLRQSPDGDVRAIAAALAATGQNERLLGSIFATLRASLRFLRYPAIRESLVASDFTLAKLCQPRVGLFLQFEEATAETTKGLFCAMISHLMRYFITHTDRPPVLLLLDEIGNVPPVPGLAQKLNTIRSRNLPTWLYWQSKDQMAPYGAGGDEGASKILAACDLQMVFRLNDNATADWLSLKIGTIDRLVKAVNVESGLLGKMNYTHSLVSEPVIYPHQLQQLDPGEIVCSWRGLSWRGYALPYFDLMPEMRGKRPQSADLRGQVYVSLDEAV